MIPATGTTPSSQKPSRAGALREASPNLIKDQVTLGDSSQDPALMGRPTFVDNSNADKKTESAGLPTWMRAVGGGLAILTLGTALTGCTRNPGNGPNVQDVPLTQEQKTARQELSVQLGQIEEGMKSMQSGSGQQQAEQVTRKVLDAARNYAKKTGRSGPGLENDLRNLLMDHPALTITTMFAVGTATGIGLEKLGLTDGISSGVSKVYEAAKAHPVIATGIVIGVGVGTAVLIHQLVQTEAQLPEKPNTPEGKTLDQTFASLEEQINQNPNLDAKQVNAQVMEAIGKYQQSSGRTWDKVKDDVVAFAFDHPILAATAVTGAGVATGVVLERAGVPNKVAGLIGVGLDSGANAAKGLVNFAKDHPVVTTAVGVGVAAGVGYLAYQHFNAAK